MLFRSDRANRERNYIEPARQHQKSGLQIEQFSNKRVSGFVDAERDGILVFSIPESPGWRLSVDGVDVATFRANMGMLAATLTKGKHSIVIEHERPGALFGGIIGVLAIMILILVIWRVKLLRSRRM